METNQNKKVFDMSTNSYSWQKLDEIVSVATHHKNSDARSLTLSSWEIIYPKTKEQYEEIQTLLFDCKNNIEDNREVSLLKRIAQLESNMMYAGTKHRTWQWVIFAGVIIAALFCGVFHMSNSGAATRAADEIAQIQNWEPSVSNIPYDSLLEKDADVRDCSSAMNYKKTKLIHIKNEIEGGRNGKTMNDYERINVLSFKETQSMALDEVNQVLARSEIGATVYLIIAALLVVLAILYIVTGYPKGYTIKRFEGAKGLLNTLQKWGFRIAVASFGAGIVMSVLGDEYAKWEKTNDGDYVFRKKRDLNILMLIIKVILIVVGILIFTILSVLIATIETVEGLIFNFDWKSKKNLIHS
jgi:hypothetical protein